MTDCIHIISNEFNILNLETWVGGWNSVVVIALMHGCVYFIDEVRFTRDGVNSKRTFHLWAYDNPQGRVEVISSIVSL